MDKLLQLFPILFVGAIAYALYAGHLLNRRGVHRGGWRRRNPAPSWRQAPTGNHASPLTGEERADQASRERRYRAKPIMTRNEHGFYWQLVKGCPRGYQVFSQVSMGALMASMADDDELSRSDFYFIAARRVDFVVWRADRNEVVLLIELDDRTHDLDKDRERDALTKTAGFDTWRIQSSQKPTIPEIRQHLDRVIAMRYGHGGPGSTEQPAP